MAMTSAERMKQYREKIKNGKVRYAAMKVKDHLRYQLKRQNSSGASLTKFRSQNKLRQQKHRENKKKIVS